MNENLTQEISEVDYIDFDQLESPYQNELIAITTKDVITLTTMDAHGWYAILAPLAVSSSPSQITAKNSLLKPTKGSTTPNSGRTWLKRKKTKQLTPVKVSVVLYSVPLT